MLPGERRITYTAGIWADNHTLLGVHVLLDPSQYARLGIEVIDRDVEEALYLRGMEIHSDLSASVSSPLALRKASRTTWLQPAVTSMLAMSFAEIGARLLSVKISPLDQPAEPRARHPVLTLLVLPRIRKVRNHRRDPSRRRRPACVDHDQPRDVLAICFPIHPVGLAALQNIQLHEPIVDVTG